MTLAFHPLANLFPLIEGPDFDAIVADMREVGFRVGEEIVMLDGMILDGRNRYRAAIAAGLWDENVNPRQQWEFVEFSADGIDGTFDQHVIDAGPLAYVLAKNLNRRHLTPSQRAMVAADIETYRHGGNRKSDQDANLQLERADAAASVQVSERTVADAAKVRDHGADELKQAVRDGYVAVSAAAEVADLPVDRQRTIVDQLRGDDGKITPEGKKALAPVIKEIRAEKQAAKKERREQREQQLGDKQRALPDKKFGVIYADPEWRFEVYSRESGMDRAADNHYPTSTTEEIAARPVQSIAADDCVLFLWATAPMLPDALQVMAAWGFAYKSHMIWKKDRIGNGYWFRNRHELLLVGTRGDVPAPALGDQWNSVIDQMIGEHSAKPEIFHELIETYFPTLPKIELNARAARPGWDAWGLEAPDTAATEQADAHGCTASSAGSEAELPASSPDLSRAKEGVRAAHEEATTEPPGVEPSSGRLPDGRTSDAAPAAQADAAELPAASAPISPVDDVLEIPAFLKRNTNNVSPIMRGIP